MIIGINGYAGSGKDTIGKLIQLATIDSIPEGIYLEDIVNNYSDNQWWIEEKSGWEIKKWAGKLKSVAWMLTGIPVEKFEDQDFKKTDMGPEWGMTVRDFLQRLGTDGLRTGLHENTWVNALMADYQPLDYDPLTEAEIFPNWIITDTRFPNEAQAIKNAGGIVIRVDRPGVSAINAHTSETALDNWDFDYKIMNGSDLVALLFSVGAVLRKAKIL